MVIKKEIKHYNVGNQFNYIDGRSLKKYYCIKCGKKISIFSGLYGSKLCRSCEMRRRHKLKMFNNKGRKGINKGSKNGMFGKVPQGNYGKWKKFKGKWMRSSWEVAFAKYCLKNRIKYRYEPKTFNLGNATYTPDFYLPEKNLYIEIKGYWYEKAKRKFNLFRKKYPNIKIKVLNNKNFNIKEER